MSEEINPIEPVKEKKKRGPKKKAAVAPVQEVAEIVTPVEEEVAVVEPAEEVVAEAEQAVEEVEQVVEEVKEAAALSINDKIIEAIKKYAPGSYIRPGRVSYWAGIIRNGGTVGISSVGRVVHLNTLSPENGGRKVMENNFKARVILNDLV
jgi:hypothetical protein